MHGALPMVEKLPGNDVLTSASVPLNELDGDLLLRLFVECQLHEARSATAWITGAVRVQGQLLFMTCVSAGFRGLGARSGIILQSMYTIAERLAW